MGRIVIASTLIVLALAGSIPGQQRPETQIDWVNNSFEVTGIGRGPENETGPQGYPLARRAALVDAYRSIAELTNMIQLDAATDVRGMGGEISTRVVSSVSARIQACQIVESEEVLQQRYQATGSVTLRCRVDLSGSRGVLSPVMDIVGPEMKKRLEALKPALYTPPPSEPAIPDYDGLIVVVPAQFKPSAYPKIRTDKAEVVYSLLNVPLEIQKSRGLANYTDDPAKATATLKAFGANTILTVAGTLYLDTEPQIKIEDAGKIAAANKKTSFLSSARVVFVIGRGA
jgi:hypothetical protein